MSVLFEDLILTYEGSVKRVWKPLNIDDILWFEFTDDYSVFDWGKMPDTIASKGKALAVIGAFFFEHLGNPATWQQLRASRHLSAFDAVWLSERWKNPLYTETLTVSGAPHHFRGLVDMKGQPLALAQAARTAPVYMQVLPAAVFRPDPYLLITRTVFYYPPPPPCRRLVPLEVVFRFGMPPGSSLKSRLEEDPDYALELGLPAVPAEGTLFSRPVLEFYTKLEPKDRLLSLQEALFMSGLTGDEFQRMTELAFQSALALYHYFAEGGVELWDGKFEFIVDADGLKLADSIGPDELRLVFRGENLSKEFVRQHYRSTGWYKALRQAQEMAATAGQLDWHSICTDKFKAEPPPLPAGMKEAVDRLYPVLANHIAGSELFEGNPPLEELSASLAALRGGGG